MASVLPDEAARKAAYVDIPNGVATEVCYVGPNAAGELSGYAKRRCGSSGLVIADENTLECAGAPLISVLRDAGLRVEERLFAAEPLDATNVLGDEVARAADAVDFIVAAGSGSLSDLAKYAGGKLGKPVLLFPSAASMNGYTSAIVALKVNGLKRTQPSVPAAGVFADPEVCASAPPRMTAAGMGDFLSKASSSTDWRVAHALRGGYFSEEPRKLLESVQDDVARVAEATAHGDVGAYATVLRALMVSGFSMAVAGSSAPASGGEHLISHYIDMKSALYGTAHDLHGAQVGVATLYCLGLWEKILGLDPVDIDIDALLVAQPDEAEIDAWIDEDWGTIASEVRAQWREKRLPEYELRMELEKFRGVLPRLRDACARDLLPPRVVEEAIRAAGGPTAPEELASPIEVYSDGQRRASYIRNRFTVLDLACELCIE
ncbi:MAG: iron-containing alcohol dehydrogenase [Candidatus Hydrogenedentes bacterium]|nr:iron-containing alcohol dehydrogenase [Candidatus Hydrogenedentota bacterium]